MASPSTVIVASLSIVALALSAGAIFIAVEEEPKAGAVILEGAREQMAEEEKTEEPRD